MKCFYCRNRASAKLGTSKGNIINALFGKKCWDKKEIYVCKRHYNQALKNEEKLKKETEKAQAEVLQIYNDWGNGI